MLERWPQVCRIKITLTLLLLTNRYISTTSNSMKCSKLCSTENPCSFEKYSTTLKNLYKFDPIQSCNGNFVPNEPSSLRKIMNFHRNSSAKLNLVCFHQFQTRFRTRSRFVYDKRAEWTSSWYGLCSKTWTPPPVGGGDFVSFNIEKAYFSREQIRCCGGGECTPCRRENNSFICLTWLIYMCDTTHACVWMTHS